MDRGEKTSESIPFDLVIEILLRLPAKSIARFRGVSKLWASLLGRPYFTELFLTRQRARPRLFFAVKSSNEFRFYSTPQTPISDRKSYYTTTFHMKLSSDKQHTWQKFRCRLTYGLIYLSEMTISEDGANVICNPNTRQYLILPRLSRYKRVQNSFLGFDPIDKQFKVLFFGYPDWEVVKDHKILTLGTGNLSWRTVHCPFKYNIYKRGVCINGVVYYSCNLDDEGHSRGIVCFDVRSETFKFVATECHYDEVINYKGKLGGVSLNVRYASVVELSLWVLEDVEKQEWLKYVYTLWDKDIVVNHNECNVSIVGMTATGEIVLSMRDTSTPFYVFYFNPESNILQSVEIQGLGENYDGYETVTAFVDHIEDFDIIDAKQLKSNQDLKIITKRPKPRKHTFRRGRNRTGLVRRVRTCRHSQVFVRAWL